MRTSLLIGLLAPALLAGAAASQTVVVLRPLPFTGVPRILPSPLAGLPAAPVRLPAPLITPALELAPLVPAAPLPAVSVDARRELPAAVRELPALRAHLEEQAAPTAEAPAPAPVLERVFDGRLITLPEDDLERELGLR